MVTMLPLLPPHYLYLFLFLCLSNSLCNYFLSLSFLLSFHDYLSIVSIEKFIYTIKISDPNIQSSYDVIFISPFSITVFFLFYFLCTKISFYTLFLVLNFMHFLHFFFSVVKNTLFERKLKLSIIKFFIGQILRKCPDNCLYIYTQVTKLSGTINALSVP